MSNRGGVSTAEGREIIGGVGTTPCGGGGRLPSLPCWQQPGGRLIGGKGDGGLPRVVAHQQGGTCLHLIKVRHDQGALGEVGEQQQGVPLCACRILPAAAIADAIRVVPIQQLEVAVANDRVGLAQGDELAIAVKRRVGAGQLLGGIYLDVIGVEGNPGRGRAESGVGAGASHCIGVRALSRPMASSRRLSSAGASPAWLAR